MCSTIQNVLPLNFEWNCIPNYNILLNKVLKAISCCNGIIYNIYSRGLRKESM